MDSVVFHPGPPAASTVDPAAWVIAVVGRDVIVAKGGAAPRLPTLAEWVVCGGASEPFAIGHLDTTPCVVTDGPLDGLPEAFQAVPLRTLLEVWPNGPAAAVTRAVELLHWHRQQRFCGCCGAATVPAAAQHARHCPLCAHDAFPRISPAVIVAVTRGPQLLLARGRRLRPGLFSVLAGFVDPGESLEEAVRREVREEVGLEVEDIRYFGSQPWPFPDALMVAFTAESVSGDIRIDPGEILEAGWYTPDRFPPLPGSASIARRLIDAFVARGTAD